MLQLVCSQLVRQDVLQVLAQPNWRRCRQQPRRRLGRCWRRRCHLLQRARFSRRQQLPALLPLASVPRVRCPAAAPG